MTASFKFPAPAIVPLIGVLLLSACEGESRPFRENVEITSLGLTTLQITPPANAQDSIFINSGETLQLGISGTNADTMTSVVLSPSDRSFRSSNPAVLSVDENGLVTGGPVSENEEAMAEISVVVGGLRSEGLIINVSNGVLTSITSIEGSPTLEACLPGEYFAVGSFDDNANSTRTLRDVSFELAEGSEGTVSSEAGVASVNATGGTGVTLVAQAGEITFDRALTVLQNLESIAITPIEPAVEEQETIELTATGIYQVTGESEEGGVSREEFITDNVQWSISSEPDNASVGNSEDDKGQLLGIAEGFAEVQAACGTVVSPSQTVTVEEASIDDSDELSFNTTRSDGVLVISVDDDDPFELRVSRGSEYVEANRETDDVTFSVNNLGDVQAITINGDEITAVTPGGLADVTAILVDSDGDEVASGTLRVRVSSTGDTDL